MNIKNAIKPTCFAIAAFLGASAGQALAGSDYKADSDGIIGMKTDSNVENLSADKAARFNNTTESESQDMQRNEMDDEMQANTEMNADQKMKDESQMDSATDMDGEEVVYFDFDSAELDQEAKSQLSEMVEDAELAGEKIEIEGFTDNVGETAYNQDLSERRAEAVKEYLQSEVKDADSLVFKAEGKGEAEPVASNDQAITRQKNRRVEIVLKNRDEMAGL